MRVFVLILALTQHFVLAEDHRPINPRSSRPVAENERDLPPYKKDPIFKEVSAKTPTYLEKDSNFIKSHPDGIRFACESEDKAANLFREMRKLLSDYGISESLIKSHFSPSRKIVQFVLDTPEDNVSTLDLFKTPKYAIKNEMVTLSLPDGTHEQIEIASKKEIVLALMQHGRLTELGENFCKTKSLKNIVGLRQSVLKWVQGSRIGVAGGEGIRINPKYWERLEDEKRGFDGEFLLKTPGKLYEALLDSFLYKNDRGTGYYLWCSKGSEIIMSLAIMDYWKEADPEIFDFLNKHATSYSLDFSIPSLENGQPAPGYVMDRAYPTSALNWAPGDWGYFENIHRGKLNLNDPKDKALYDLYSANGSQGHNSIYVGNGYFGAYPGVLRERDIYDKMKYVLGYRHEYRPDEPEQEVTKEILDRLARHVPEGGMVAAGRDYPKLFGPLPVSEKKPTSLIK